MGTRGVRGVLLAILAATSGCIGPGAPDSEPVSVSSGGDGVERPDATVGGAGESAPADDFGSSLAERFSAIPLEGDPDTGQWFLAAGSAGPRKSISGFAWQVPAGALVTHRSFPEDKVLALEVAPVTTAKPEEISQWFLLVFIETKGELVLWESVISPKMKVQERTTPGSPPVLRPEDPAGRLAPFFMRIWPLEPKQALYVVVGAESPAPAEFGVAMRLLTKDPGFEAEPVKDLDAFLNATAGKAARLLPRTGEGQGFKIPVYFEINQVFSGTNRPLTTGTEGFSRDVTVVDALPPDARPAVTARDVTISYEFPVAAGWGHGFAFAQSSFGGGLWSADVSLHGEVGSDRYLMGPSQTGVPLPSELRWGYGVYEASGEGKGAGRASMRLTFADVNRLEYVFFEHVDLAMTLEDLLGARGRSSFITASGVLPDETQRSIHVRADGGDLILESRGGPTSRIRDVANSAL